MTYKLLNSDHYSEWKQYLAEIPVRDQDVYFTPEYYDIYEKNGEGKSACFIYRKNGNTGIYPFFLNRINELGFDLKEDYFDIQGAYGYNGCLFSSNDQDFLSGFYQAFTEYCSENNIVAEFTRFHPLLANHRLAGSNMNVIFDRKTVALDLTLPYESIWNEQYSGNNRNMIRKAEKAGITIKLTDLLVDYFSFYTLYTKTMDQVAADSYYFFDENYFKNFYNNLSGNSLLFLACYEGRMIAGSLFMFNNRKLHYHLSARDSEYSKLPANNMILDHAVKWGIKNGFSVFFLGGGTDSDPNNSLLKFKSNFSNDTRDFYIGKRVHNQEIYSKIVTDWESKYPEKKEIYKNHLLKYRY